MPGPLFAVTVAKGYRDKKAGIFTATGHAIVEIPLIIIIYLGFLKFLSQEYLKTVIGILGGIVLLYIAMDMLKERKNFSLEGKDLPYNYLVAGIITTCSNPYFFIWWAGIGSALISESLKFGNYMIVLFSLIHWLCDLFFYSAVSFTVYNLKKLWRKETYQTVIFICSFILIGFGIFFLYKGIFVK